MTRPDDLIFKEIFKPKRLVDDIDKQDALLEKVKKSTDPYRPKEEEFSDIYSKEEIENDLHTLNEHEKNWEKDETPQGIALKKISTIYEGVLVEQIEQNNWFGDQVTMYPASRHDDVRNGVDAIGEFKNEDGNKYLGLGIDVVFTSDPERIKQKLNSIKKLIDSKHLASVKYFEDEDGNKKSLSVPKVIVGSRLSSAEKLITTWATKRSDRQKTLATDPTQTKIILEAYMQLYYFYNYAKKKNLESIAEAYEETLNVFKEIMESKKDIIARQANEVSDDIVYETIKEYTGM